MRRRTTILIAIFLTLFLLLVGGYLAMRSIVASIIPSIIPSETTDVGQYQTILERWQPSGLVDHFPAAFPSNAANVRLSFFPGFLQGGAHFQVRMELPPADVASIEDRMRQTTIHQYQGGSFFEHYNQDQQHNLPTTFFHTADNPHQSSFPRHYTLHVLHAEKHRGGWNHGETYGVATSGRKSEVIYWAESW